MSTDRTVIVMSSNGKIEINPATGVVVSIKTYPQSELPNVIVFNVTEWRHHYSTDLDDEIDILDIGYWYTDSIGEIGYEPPCQSFRKDAQELREYCTVSQLRNLIETQEQGNGSHSTRRMRCHE